MRGCEDLERLDCWVEEKRNKTKQNKTKQRVQKEERKKELARGD